MLKEIGQSKRLNRKKRLYLIDLENYLIYRASFSLLVLFYVFERELPRKLVQLLSDSNLTIFDKKVPPKLNVT